ncbi:MAG: putative RNA uridine N3 methyltransferase [Promethearchaeota archaeon]
MKISIAIPDSTLADCANLRSATEKVFRLARSFALFRVSRCIIYRSPLYSQKKAKKDRIVLVNLLRYLETPQYLRKRLFHLSPELRHAGSLRPLAMKHHLTHKEPKNGEIREGCLFLSPDNVPFLDLGLNNLIKPTKIPNISLRNRVVRVACRIHIKDNKPHIEILETFPYSEHLIQTFDVKETNATLGKMITGMSSTHIVATSRHCQPYWNMSNFIIPKNAKHILFLFGSPQYGLEEILKSENLKISDVASVCLNVIPSAATRSVRLEEALMLSLFLFRQQEKQRK